jgi:shikimate kinase
MDVQTEPAPAQPAASPGFEPRRTIVLVGLMGAGKTKIGRRLAARLHLPFADSDEAIETSAA